MGKTKIKIDISAFILVDAEKVELVLYDSPNRNIAFRYDVPLIEKNNERLVQDLEFEPFVPNITGFNIYALSKNNWNNILSGVPSVSILDNGEIIFQVNEKCKKDSMITAITKDGQKKLSTIESNFVNEILGKENPQERNSSPTAKDMAKSLAASLANWAKQGFEIVTEETLNKRLEICGKCEFWDANGFAGTGRCQKCGCSTQAKLRLATSACPLDPPKWVAE